MKNKEQAYHAHVYFDLEKLQLAASLREVLLGLSQREGINKFHVGKMHLKPVGPHPMAQFELHFYEGALNLIKNLLMPFSFSVLIHPITDDDHKDHGESAIWLGKRLELNTSVLEPQGQNSAMARFALETS